MPTAVQAVATWTRPAAWLLRLRERYGRRFTIQLPHQRPFVILSDPDEVKQVFQAPPDVLHPGEGTRALEPMVGSTSVFMLDEDPHLEQRRLLLPAFHGNSIERLGWLMTELTHRELDGWPTGEAVELHPRLQRLTLEVILAFAFGLGEGERLTRVRDILTEWLRFGESPLSLMSGLRRLARVWPAQARFLAQSEELDRELYELIEERRALGDLGDDILTMLLASRHLDGSPMTPQEIRDELMTTIVAGHETTASQLSWGFEQLARHPRVVEELRADESGEYLTATVHEILRRKPVIPQAGPRVVKRPITIGDWEYPPDVALLPSAFLIHHDAEIYPDPYAFRPERWLGVKPGTYTWLPFGGGRRRCLGASFAMHEMEIVIRAVTERFDLAKPVPRPERTMRRSITFSPAEGARIVLSERSARSVPAGAQIAAA
jgi:cytochrome P450